MKKAVKRSIDPLHHKLFLAALSYCLSVKTEAALTPQSGIDHPIVRRSLAAARRRRARDYKKLERAVEADVRTFWPNQAPALQGRRGR